MKHVFFLLLALVTLPGHGQTPGLTIGVHPGVELLTIVQRLAGKYPPSTPSAYEKEVVAAFGPFQNHPAVRALQRFQGTVYPDLTELGFCFADSPALPLAIPDSSGWYRRYGRAQVMDYLQQCAAFATDSHFRQFYLAHAPAYASWGTAIAAGLQQDRLLDKLHGFYRAGAPPRFYICLDPLNGWGAHATPHPEQFNPVYAGTKAYTLGFSAHPADSTKMPVFAYGDYATNLMWHEGGHLYLQDLFGRHRAQIDALAYLFNRDDPGMQAQNIRTWTYCLNENVVRGVVLALFKQHKAARAWRRQNAQEILSDFVYAEAISQIILADYIGKKKYPTFEDFFPVLLRKLQKRYPAKT